MDDDDTDIFAVSPLDKYENRPDSLENMCLADFIANYRHKSATDADPVEENTIEGYLKPVAGYINDDDNDNNDINNDDKIPDVIKLKNDLGDMKKRIRPCVPRSHRVSKEKSPEGYYMRLLQLYWPWRDESQLKHEDGTYTSKFDEVEELIDGTIRRFENYVEIDPEDLEQAYANSSDEESDCSDSDSDVEDDLSFFNTDNLDIDPNDIDSVGGSTACRVTNVNMENDMFYKLCSQLNEEQRFLFNFIMRQAQEQLHFESNNLNPPDPYFIFLSGGGGVGKTHTVKGVIEYLRRHLKFKDQKVDDQPSVLVCASTGTAAVRIKGQTLHSSFNLPRGQCSNSKLGNDKLAKLQNKCAFLKTVIHDEISMTGNGTWNMFENRLREAKQIKKENYTKSAYGDVSILAVGDFFQLPPVKQDYVFDNINKDSLEVFSRDVWKDIMRNNESCKSWNSHSC